MGKRNLDSFNEAARAAIEAGAPLADPRVETVQANEDRWLTPLPRIVVVIDELADLMMVAGKEAEQLIARLAQKSRAIGIVLIIATQRPSVDVVTGQIKANIPARICLQTHSKVDSRTVLDQSGAEALLGDGDMLYLAPGARETLRVQGSCARGSIRAAVTASS